MNCVEMFINMAESTETKTIAEKSFDYYCEKVKCTYKVVAKCDMITDKKTSEVLNVSNYVWFCGMTKGCRTYAESVAEAERIEKTGDFYGLE